MFLFAAAVLRFDSVIETLVRLESTAIDTPNQVKYAPMSNVEAIEALSVSSGSLSQSSSKEFNHQLTENLFVWETAAALVIAIRVVTDSSKVPSDFSVLS